MPDTDELKRKLRLLAIANSKAATETQLTLAANVLVKKAHVTAQDMQVLGESVGADQKTFATTDIDDINDVLSRLKNK